MFHTRIFNLMFQNDHEEAQYFKGVLPPQIIKRRVSSHLKSHIIKNQLVTFHSDQPTPPTQLVHIKLDHITILCLYQT